MKILKIPVLIKNTLRATLTTIKTHIQTVAAFQKSAGKFYALTETPGAKYKVKLTQQQIEMLQVCAVYNIKTSDKLTKILCYFEIVAYENQPIIKQK